MLEENFPDAAQFQKVNGILNGLNKMRHRLEPEHESFEAIVEKVICFERGIEVVFSHKVIADVESNWQNISKGGCVHHMLPQRKVF